MRFLGMAQASSCSRCVELSISVKWKMTVPEGRGRIWIV
jgi:hypothetical protein